MRQVYTTVSLLLFVTLTACNGGGSSALPAMRGSDTLAPNGAARTLTASRAVNAANVNAAASSYTAPLYAVTSTTTLLLSPQGPCGYIPATAAAGYTWPAAVTNAKAGTILVVSGTLSYANAWSQQNGCPTGGIVATGAVLQGASPAPVPSPASGYTYTAPWGYFTAWNVAAVRPQGNCHVHVTLTGAKGFNWPQTFRTLGAGPLVTVSGTPSYNTSADKQNDCPTGGIVTTAIALVAGAPSPAPTTTPGGGGIAFGNVPPNYDPASSWRPYSATSPWNQLLPQNPTVDPNSAAKIAWLNSPQFGGIDQAAPVMAITTPYNAAAYSTRGGQYPYYFAKLSDPAVSLRCTAGYGQGGSNASCPLEGKSVHIPAGARQAPNSDGHLIVIQPDGTEIDAWTWGTNQTNGQHQNAPWYNGETVYLGWGGFTNVASSSGFDEGVQGGSASAAGSDGLAGQIREPEMAAHQINHALRVETYCSPASVYPSTTYGASSNCNGAPSSGPSVVAMGARLWLSTPDAAIDSYPIPEHEKTIMRALHDYGAYFTDTNNYIGLAINGIETPQVGAIYGADVVDSWAASNLNSGGGGYYFSIGTGDFDRYITPNLKILAPCATVGFPGGRC